jgi:hypothetical protein
MKRDQQSNPAQEDTLFGGTSVDDSRKLGVVRARFVGHEHNSFEDLVSGYSSMRVLTYSNSLSMISRTAALLDDLEIVFGREDIVGEAEKLYWYQDELVRAVRDQIKSADPLRKKIEAGNLRLFVVKDLVSHEKLILLEAEDGNKRVLTGSANFSERAFSGKQNEGYVLYDDDEAAWDYYRGRYERLKAASALGVPKRALLSEELDVGDLPAFSEENGADSRGGGPLPGERGSSQDRLFQDPKAFRRAVFRSDKEQGIGAPRPQDAQRSGHLHEEQPPHYGEQSRRIHEHRCRLRHGRTLGQTSGLGRPGGRSPS